MPQTRPSALALARGRSRARRSRACRGRRRSGNGATGSCSCAAPRASPGRTCRTSALAADPDWLAPFLVGKTRLDEIGADDLAAGAARPACRGTSRAGSTRRRRPISWRRPARPRRSTTRPRAGLSIALRVQELFGLAEHPSRRRRAHPADAPSALAGASADPDHARPARFLARLLGRRPLRPARPLSAPLLAGGSGEGCADEAGEAAGNVRPVWSRTAPGAPAKRITPP